MTEREGSIDLYRIPLGAGAHVVRISGRLFEAISAAAGRSARCDRYHSALVESVAEGHFVIEQAPVPDLHGARRGVVAQGAVGTRWAGRFRIFRYEIRRWRDGTIPDIRTAIAWALARSGIVILSIQPPAGGRAPGWKAGLIVARR